MTCPVFRYENFFLGIINPYYVHPFAPTYGAYHKPPGYPKGKVGQLEISLAYSRDGRAWHRPDDRSPVVPVGKPGAQDGGMLYPGRESHRAGRRDLDLLHGQPPEPHLVGLALLRPVEGGPGTWPS